MAEPHQAYLGKLKIFKQSICMFKSIYKMMGILINKKMCVEDKMNSICKLTHNKSSLIFFFFTVSHNSEMSSVNGINYKKNFRS